MRVFVVPVSFIVHDANVVLYVVVCCVRFFFLFVDNDASERVRGSGCVCIWM